MSKKVSILSRLKGLFIKNTGTNLSKYQSDVEIPERYETREYKAGNHFYVKKIYLDNGSSMEELLEDIDGYCYEHMVDHAGYEIDDINTYKGEVYIVYSNTVDVVARVDEFRVPGGLIASRYIGTSLTKVTKKR